MSLGRKPYLQVTTDTARMSTLRGMTDVYAANQSAVTNLALDVLNDLTWAQQTGARVVLHYADGKKKVYKLPIRQGLTPELLDEVTKAQAAFTKARTRNAKVE